MSLKMPDNVNLDKLTTLAILIYAARFKARHKEYRHQIGFGSVVVNTNCYASFRFSNGLIFSLCTHTHTIHLCEQNLYFTGHKLVNVLPYHFVRWYPQVLHTGSGYTREIKEKTKRGSSASYDLAVYMYSVSLLIQCTSLQPKRYLAST